MIANAVNVEITGMYAVIVAIGRSCLFNISCCRGRGLTRADWFLDRFRTAINVTGDLYAARIFEVQTGIKDGDDEVVPDVQQIFGVRREQV